MAQRKVLVVDDSATVARVLQKILDDSGRYTVVWSATDGLQALQKYAELSPDLVCMDMVMPNVDGLQALEQIVTKWPDARVVMITSVGGVAEVVNRCLQAGAKNVISKPFEEKRVLAILDGL